LLDIVILEQPNQTERSADRADLCHGLHTRPICLWHAAPGSHRDSRSGRRWQASGCSRETITQH
jgi:hypothetical protein